MARASTGHIPEPVIWDQTSILREIAALRSALSTLTHLTVNPTTDTRGTVTRNVRDFEIIEAIQENTAMLRRISEQLEILN